MTTPGAHQALLDHLRECFTEARERTRDSDKIAPNSYGAGYNTGYQDAFDELIEHITGESASAFLGDQGKTPC